MAEQDRKYIDFDAMMAEWKRPPIVVRIFAEEHELPGSMPALLPILIMRRHQEGAANLTDQDTLDLALAIFGQAKVDAWLKRGLTIEQFDALVTTVVEQYGDELQDRMKAARAAKAKPGRRRS